MALNKLRQDALRSRKAELEKPNDLTEVKIDVDHKDFDSALEELITKAEALVAIAPEDKADKLQGIVDMLKECAAQREASEEESPEGPEMDMSEEPEQGNTY